MSAVSNIRDKWAQKTASAVADLCSQELIPEMGVAVAVVLIGTGHGWSYSLRVKEETGAKEEIKRFAQILRELADKMERGEEDHDSED